MSTLTGKIHRIGEMTSKENNGKTYVERQVTLFVAGQYPNYPTFTIKKEDTAKAIGQLTVGADVTMHYEVRGVEYEKDGVKKNFTQVVAWKFEAGQQSAPQNIPTHYAPPMPTSNGAGVEDDLPF